MRSPSASFLKEMPELCTSTTLATYVVAGAFVVSGYLVALASRVNSKSFGDYLWRRILRLYPGCNNSECCSSR